MIKGIIIKNGRIIDPSQSIDEKGDVLVGKGIIKKCGGTLSEEGYEIIDASGMVVCPGFIDLHCHLREPGFEEKETIKSGSAAAVKGGYTTICCMPNTNPPIDNEASITAILKKAAENVGIRVLPIGSITKGREGKELSAMGEMAEAGAVAFSDDGSSVADSSLLQKAMEYSRIFGLPIIEHCEDSSLAKGGQINEGITATKLGLKGIPNAAEDIMIARDISLAQTTGAKLHIAHVSTKGGVEIIRNAKEQGVDVTAEVTPHHLTLTEDYVGDYNTDAKVNPPLRTSRDIEALIEGLKDGTIDIIATDHAPHTINDKLCEFCFAPFGISNFETALGMLMGLVASGKIDLNTLISKLTYEPAKLLCGEHKKLGTLKESAAADITIFDPEEEWVVKSKDFISKGKNTPLDGARLKGKVKFVIAGGKTTYRG